MSLSLDNLDSLDNIDDLSDDAIMNLLEGMGNEENEVDDDNYNDDNNSNKCISCNNNTNLYTDISNGIRVCKNCGQVNNNIMDQKPEWRNNDGGNGISNRCGTPINHFLPQSSLGTTIAGPNIGNVKRLQSWSMMPYRERSLYNVLKEISNKCTEGKILKCIEDDAKIFYKKISEYKHTTGKNKGKHVIIRGRHRISLIAACIFFACKKNKKSRTIKEIAKLFNLNYRNITKGCKTFCRLISLRNICLSINSSSPDDYVYRFCVELKMEMEYIIFAQKIARNIKRLSIASTHTAMSIATASILLTILMNDLTITKKHIAEKFKVSEVTITKTYKTIESYRDILISDEKTDKIVKGLETKRDNIEMPEHIAKKYKIFQDKYLEENQKHKIYYTIDLNNSINHVMELNDNLNKEIDKTEKMYSKIKINNK